MYHCIGHHCCCCQRRCCPRRWHRYQNMWREAASQRPRRSMRIKGRSHRISTGRDRRVPSQLLGMAGRKVRAIQQTAPEVQAVHVHNQNQSPDRMERELRCWRHRDCGASVHGEWLQQAPWEREASWVTDGPKAARSGVEHQKEPCCARYSPPGYVRSEVPPCWGRCCWSGPNVVAHVHMALPEPSQTRNTHINMCN